MKPSTNVAALMALGILTTVGGAVAVHAATSTPAPSPQVTAQTVAPTATQSGDQEVGESTSGKPDTDTETNEKVEVGETGTDLPDSPTVK